MGDDQLSPEQRKCKVKEKHVATSSLIEFPCRIRYGSTHLQPTCKKMRASEEQSPHVMRGPSLRERVERAAQRRAIVVAGSRPSTVGWRLAHTCWVTPFTGSWPMNEL